MLPSQIDYSFDNIDDNDLRIQMIVQELNRLSKVNLEQLSNSMEDVVEHNYRKALEIVKTEKHSPNVAEHYKNIIERARRKANELS